MSDTAWIPPLVKTCPWCGRSLKGFFNVVQCGLCRVKWVKGEMQTMGPGDEDFGWVDVPGGCLVVRGEGAWQDEVPRGCLVVRSGTSREVDRG